MSEDKSYTIITRDELIRLNTFGEITIPSKDRYIDGRLSKEQVSKIISNHLITLGMRETSNYLLARFPVPDDTSYLAKSVITLSLAGLDALLCLDEDACSFYRDKVGGGHYYECADIPIDMDSIIKESNKIQNRLLPIFSEVFKFSESELNKNRDFSQSQIIHDLSKFKRECILKKEDLSFLNDVITFALITISDGDAKSFDNKSNGNEKVKNYRGGIDIAKDSIFFKKIKANSIDSEKDVLVKIEGYLHSKDEHLRKLDDKLKSINKEPIEFNELSFSYTIFCFMYLKVKALYREMEENQPEEIMKGLLDWYHGIIQNNQRVAAAKLAIYCLITEFGWSAFADSFYKWRQLATFQKPSDYESIGDTAIRLKRELSESQSEAARLGQELSDSQKSAKELEQQLTTSRSEAQDFQKQLSDSQSEAARLDQELSDSQKSAKDLEQQLTTSRSEAQDFQKQLSDSQSEAARLDQELSDSQKSAKDLEQQLTTSRSEAQDFQKQLTASHSEAATLGQELIDSQHSVKDLEQQLTTSRSEAQDFQKQLSDSQSEAARLDQELSDSQKSAKDLEQQLTTSRSEAQDFQKQLTASHSEAARLGQELTDSQHSAKDLEQQLTTSRSEAQDFQKQLTASQNNAKDLEQQLTTSRFEAQDLQKQLTASQDKIYTLEQEHANNQTIIAKLTSTVPENTVQIAPSPPENKKTLLFSIPKTPAQINRLKKQELLDLCQEWGLPVGAKLTNDALKQQLIEKLNHLKKEIVDGDLFE